MEATESARLMEIKQDQRRASLKMAGAKRVHTDKNGCTFGTFGDVTVMVNDVTEPEGLVNLEMKDGTKFTNLSGLGFMEQIRPYNHSDIARYHGFNRYHRAQWSPSLGEFLNVTITDERFEQAV